MMYVVITPAGRQASAAPLTLTRDLAECPVANRPLVKAQELEVKRAGYALDSPGRPPPRGEPDPLLFLMGNAWVDAADLRRLGGSRRGLALRSADGVVLAFASSGETLAADTPGLEAANSFPLRYPWDLLAVNERLLARLTESAIEGEMHERATVDGLLVLGPGSRLLPGVYVEGTVVIGRDCKIGPNCYLRGPTAIGDHCRIGQGVEIKASILMDGVSVSHLSYVGDSILGTGTNFGGGTITANYRHDGADHRSLVNGELVSTGRQKFGTICGDGVHTGIHTTIYPGRKLWPGTWTRPGAVVETDLTVVEELPK